LESRKDVCLGWELNNKKCLELLKVPWQGLLISISEKTCAIKCSFTFLNSLNSKLMFLTLKSSSMCFQNHFWQLYSKLETTLCVQWGIYSASGRFIEDYLRNLVQNKNWSQISMTGSKEPTTLKYKIGKYGSQKRVDLVDMQKAGLVLTLLKKIKYVCSLKCTDNKSTVAVTQSRNMLDFFIFSRFNWYLKKI
jgi:hypothetical protein